MRKTIFSCCLLLLGALPSTGQGARNIRINEVMTANTQGIVDKYDRHLPWIELVNTSYSTYNVRGMFITTNRRVLDKHLTAPQRIRLMSIIPGETEETCLKARQHLVLYLASHPAKGSAHLSAPVGSPLWLALYDGNGIDLIDSVTVPPLAPNTAYARYTDGARRWVVKAADAVTPGTENFIQVTETKVAKWKREDPHGLALSLLSMGIVFSCLALLYLVFRFSGSYMEHRQRISEATHGHPHFMSLLKAGKKVARTAHKTTVILKEGSRTAGIDKEVYIAVISMALHEYLEKAHDMESNIITIRPKQTRWNNIG